ncbi:hypothetical protein Pcinc_040678 [Petrolisthes cinctipes]|uniref:Uncharacterized protein n=1 Tax=Petrolisthes cinctipes TaxID=88211 RepID=A0AAE1BNQ2_PETCI|nr:hypothetical protein Pcinc_040678 [Petrolisthes cinctipes]
MRVTKQCEGLPDVRCCEVLCEVLCEGLPDVRCCHVKRGKMLHDTWGTKSMSATQNALMKENTTYYRLLIQRHT